MPPATPILTPPKPGSTKFLPMLVGLFAVGTIVFGVVAAVSYNKLVVAERTKADEVSRASEQAKALGKAEAEAFYKEQIETPYRRYTAPDFAGRFAIIFPKSWNVLTKESEAASKQIELIAHPDFIVELPGDNTYALRVELTKQSFADRKQDFDNLVKSGKLKSENVTVSGIAAIRLTGKYDNKHDGVLVLVPVRDKTITIATEDRKFLPEFEQILQKAIITP